MKTRIPAYIAATIAALGFALAQPEAPTIDAAKAIAKEQNRSILVELTGKDWCPGCIYLKGKILDSDVFDKAVGDKYILVEIDYPRDPKKIQAIPEAEREARADLLKSYKVGGLPCVIYMDADGLPYAIYSDYTQTPEEYIEKFISQAEATRAARDAAFAKAAPLEGMEKARALVAALETLPEVCRWQYTDVLGEIAQLDPGNTLGYTNTITDANLRLAQLKEWEEMMRAHFAGLTGSASTPEKIQATLTLCEEYLKREDLIPEVRQRTYGIMADSYAFMRNIPMVFAMAHRTVNEMPTSDFADKYRRIINYYETSLLDASGQREEAYKAAAPYMKKK